MCKLVPCCASPAAACTSAKQASLQIFHRKLRHSTAARKFMADVFCLVTAADGSLAGELLTSQLPVKAAQLAWLLCSSTSCRQFCLVRCNRHCSPDCQPLAFWVRSWPAAQPLFTTCTAS